MKSRSVESKVLVENGSFISSTGRIILSITNLCIIFLNLLTIFLYGLRFENFIVVLVSAGLFYLERQNIFEVVVFILAYPLSWIFFIPLRNEEIEDFFNVPIPPEIRLNIDENIKGVLPIKTILVIGNTNEKKSVARKIVNYVIHGIDIEENMKYLSVLLRDPHMDVALYAGQALEDIENYFEEKIAKTKNCADVESCLLVYYYLRTGIPKGVLREELKKILWDRLYKMSNRIPQYYEILYYLTHDENYLLQGYNVTHEPDLIRKFLLEKLSKREYRTVKENLTLSFRKLLCKTQEVPNQLGGDTYEQ